MRLAFYPGCSLEGMADDYSRSIRAVFAHLDIGLVDIADWSCCGATAAHSLSEEMAVILPARNIAAAERMGLDMVAPCANCFNRLRYSQTMLRRRIHDTPWPVTGSVAIHDMTRFLADPVRIGIIRQALAKPLEGLRTVCYYGCQMVRPPRITGYTDFENPLTLDRLVEAAGATALDWSFKATCCGAGIGIGRRDIQTALTRRILDKARQAGAEAVVVSCPLCQANLDLCQALEPALGLPVFYFTELLQIGFGLAPGGRFRSHIVDPMPLLSRKGLVP